MCARFHTHKRNKFQVDLPTFFYLISITSYHLTDCILPKTGLSREKTLTMAKTNKKARLFVLFGSISLLATIFSMPAFGFGKNKVQYREFDWRYHSLPNMKSYYHRNQGDLPRISALWSELAHQSLRNDWQFETNRPIPLIVFGSPTYFEQTNVIPNIIPEGVGGFTEMFKSRIVIPFSGDYEEYRHVLHHELVHAFQYAMLYDNMGNSFLRTPTVRMPLWFAEGTAEYLSSGWDISADMFMMDRVVHSSVPLPGPELGGYMAYKGGQSFMHFLESSRGDSAFTEFLSAFRKTKTVESAVKKVYNQTLRELGKEWIQELKRIYWPEIGRRQRPDKVGKQITSHAEGRSHFNLKGRISPDGSRIAYYSDRKDYTRIIVTDSDGKTIAEIGQQGFAGFFESFQPFRAGLCWGPDNQRLAFVTKNQGRNEIRIIDIETKELVRTIQPDLAAISRPDWSPDGKRITFCGLKEHMSDIYVYDLDSDTLSRLTSNIMFEADPRFSPDGGTIIFSAQDTSGTAARKPKPTRANHDLYLIDIADKTVTRLTDTPYDEKQPVFGPDSVSIAFISDKTGIDNIYVGAVDSITTAKPITDLIGGCSSPDWCRSEDRLVFTLFQKQGWDIWRMDSVSTRQLEETPAVTRWAESQLEGADPFFFTAEIPKRENEDESKLGITEVIETDSSDTADAAGEGISEKKVPNDETVATETSIEETSGDTTEGAMDEPRPHKSTENNENEDDISADLMIAGVGMVGAESEFDSAKSTDTSDTNDLAMSDSAEKFDTTKNVIDPDTLQSKDYRLVFTPDAVSFGFGLSTYYGAAGQGMILLSDMLGNHRIGLAGDLRSDLSRLNFFGSYLNSQYRTDFGLAGFYSRDYTISGVSLLDRERYHDTNIGGMFFLRYPFSTFSRVDLSVHYRKLNRVLVDSQDEEAVFGDTLSTNLTMPTLSYVWDNTLWGITGPVNGLRAKTNFLVSPALGPNDRSFFAFDSDLRKYLHVAGKFVWANRVAFGAAFPINEDESARRYFLGGNENWFNYRANKDNYEESLPHSLYSEYMVPFRGWNYFDLTGTRFAMLNSEFRFPFLREIDFVWPLPIKIRYVNGAVFVDAGNAWDRGDQMESIPLPTKIYGGIGFGLRVNLGIFVLRYDRAWKTDWNHYVKNPINYFSLGAEY